MNKFLKILVVEDQALTAENIKITLQDEGHTIVGIAKNYTEVVMAVMKHRPELIIMDIELENSEHDGIDTIAEIRSITNIPVIFLTGKDDTETFSKASATHPEGFLLKPFKPRDLVNQVELVRSRVLSHNAVPDIIYVFANRSHIRVKRNEVIFLQADRVFTSIYRHHVPEPLLVTVNIGHFCKQFPEPHFYRLSQSLMINLNFLVKVKDNELFFEGTDKVLKVSDTKKAELKKQLNIIRTPRLTKTIEE